MVANMARVLDRWSCGCFGLLKADELEQRKRSRRIDKALRQDKRILKRQVKLLLLGAGESGKSTFLKQMRIIHQLSFEEETIQEFRLVIYQNVVRGMKVLVDARNKLGIPWEHSDLSCPAGERVMAYEPSHTLDGDLFAMYLPYVQLLWQDRGIWEAFDRRSEFQLSDGVRYLFDNLDRIGAPNYIPSTQDVLYARKATKGITEYSVPINGIPFKFVDVGGQRSQRQKWFQCFESVTSVLFMVSSSEFDQVLLEDRSVNRLHESRAIFETIVNNRSFAEISIILFLNKTDLLKEKVQKRGTNIQCYFPDFQGDPTDLEQVQGFIFSLFDACRKERKRQLFHHFTTAVDTENIKVVFNAVRETILQKNITQLMLQ